MIKFIKNQSLLQHLKSLFIRLFEYNADKRIKIDEIISHEWFKNIQSYNVNTSKQLYFQSIMKNIHFQVSVNQDLKKQHKIIKFK